jgi:nicotinic acid mononucleotide adenylyltransferase
MRRVHLLVVERPGAPAPDVAGCPQARAAVAHTSAAEHATRALTVAPVRAGCRVAQATVVPVAGLTDVSSSAARASLARGGDAAGALHPEVLAYIREHGLYAIAPA